MSAESLSFLVPDLSSFARSLGSALRSRHAEGADPPGHVETLNLIARALGHRNVQSLQAALRVPAVARVQAVAPAPLSAHAHKALAQFDAQGRLVRWPNKLAVQRLVLWVLWTRFEFKRVYTEAEVNEILKVFNTFGDHVILRRELVNHGLLARPSDCSAYRKQSKRPDDQARALIHAWRQRMRGAPGE